MSRPGISPLRRALLPGSLRFQLLSRSLLVISALLLLIGSLQYVLMKQFMYKNKAETISNQLVSVPGDMWQRGMLPRREGPQGFPPLFFDSSVAFIDTSGNFTVLQEDPVTETAPRFSDDEYNELLQPNKPRFRYHVITDTDGKEKLAVLQPVNGRGRPAGVVQLTINTSEMRNVLLTQLLNFLGLSLASLLIALLTFLPVIRRTLVPLSNMVETVERINAGNLNERLPAHLGQTEVDRLACSFNAMLERLELSFRAEQEAKEHMRRFIADASHELRTPLTSIHGFLEVLLRGAANQPEQLDKALKSMYGESGRIIKLVQDLLQLAKLDRTPTLQKVEGTLGDVIHEMEAQLHLLAGDRAVAFAIAPGIKTLFDKDKIKQVVLNLFHNAVQHTDPVTGKIGVSLHMEGGRIAFEVRDNGPGIASEHVSRLFDRFYRVDTSRARKQGGAGLGLSITQALVELHGGEIEVESVVGEGSLFRVLLPVDGNEREKLPQGGGDDVRQAPEQG